MTKNIQFLISILGLNLVFLPIFFFSSSPYRKQNTADGKVLRNFLLFILAEYFVCLAAVTIVPLPFSKAGAPYLNLDAFHQTYNNLFSAYYHTSARTVFNELENLIGNIILFSPLGFLLPLLYNRYRNFIVLCITAFTCSFTIEAIQYFISINWGYNRISDIDDLILNVIGAILGFLFYILLIFALKLLRTRNK